MYIAYVVKLDESEEDELDSIQEHDTEELDIDCEDQDANDTAAPVNPASQLPPNIFDKINRRYNC